jgi:N utilization substance protein A
MSTEIIEAMTALANEKGISPDRLIAALEDALLSAYMKQPNAVKYARVQLDPQTGDYRVIELIVPERLEAQLIVEAIDEGTYLDPDTGEFVEPEEPEITQEKFAEHRDQIEERDVTPDDFGRIAAQTAKQVILQRVREAERDIMFEEYQDRVGELINGIVQQSDSRYTLVQLGVGGRVEALLPRSEQVDGERYDHGQRVKAVIKEVSDSTKGPSIILSRRDPELIKALFELEVPEIADGLVEVANVAREPGYRSKIAVVSYADGVDPVGACVGPRGSRVRMVVSELRGEKIDIIPYNDEPARFVAKALSPARVREVLVDDEARQATVIVPDDQLALAIGREGQNARLAARLTGWRIDIRSETEFASEGGGEEGEVEEAGGRCLAVLSNGRRCPNAALPGTSYCGLPAHVALGRFQGNSVALVAELSEDEVEEFASDAFDESKYAARISDIEEKVSAAQAEEEARKAAEEAAAAAAAEEEAAAAALAEEQESGDESQADADDPGDADTADDGDGDAPDDGGEAAGEEPGEDDETEEAEAPQSAEEEAPEGDGDSGDDTDEEEAS